MNLYFKALKLHLKSELEYRASFIISFLSQILVFFSYYFVIIARYPSRWVPFYDVFCDAPISAIPSRISDRSFAFNLLR